MPKLFDELSGVVFHCCVLYHFGFAVRHDFRQFFNATMEYNLLHQSQNVSREY